MFVQLLVVVNPLVLSSKHKQKDLEVVVSYDFKITAQCNTASSVGFRVLRSLRIALKFIAQDAFQISYLVYMRLI